MPRVDTGNVELFYESFGDGEPLVLIAGIGAQMLLWYDPFCERLAQAGFRVIRFDNRDVGESTRLDHLGVPPIRRAMLRWTLGRPVTPLYTLRDMALDVRGLLDALDIPRAHVAGISMGGMVAQQLAISAPDRVRSLTSIMSSPGDWLSALPRPDALMALLQKPPRTADEAGQRLVDFMGVVGGPAAQGDQELVREMGHRAFARGGANPRGFARQYMAVMAAGDRRSALARLRMPALVIHGTVDPLVRPRGGHQTAGALVGAEHLVIDGMGHHLASMHWGRVIEAMGRTAARAEPDA